MEKSIDYSKQPLLRDLETRKIITKLLPIGKCTGNGLTTAYNTIFPLELKEKIHEEEYRIAITAINEIANDYFPCTLCQYASYPLVYATCGCGSIVLKACTHDYISHLQIILRRINQRPAFRRKGIEWELQSTSFNTWIEITEAVTLSPIAEGRLAPCS